MKGEFYKTTDMMDKVDAALNCVGKKLRGWYKPQFVK
jgi:hypothetical protein